MSKFVAKFRKENDYYDYNDDYATKQNRYDRKKRDKTKEFQKRNRDYDPYDSYDSDWYNQSRKMRR